MPKSNHLIDLNVAVIAFDGISPFHLSVPSLVFGDCLPIQNLPIIRVLVCAAHSGTGPHTVETNSGFKIQTEYGLSSLKEAQLIIVPSWRDDLESAPKELLSSLRNAHSRGARIVGLCLGAFVLAEAGLLDDRSATTHWAAAQEFQNRYPQVSVDANVLFVDHGDVITSAGTAAALDCCLHILRAQFGSEIATRVARMLVVAPHRQGGQAQYIEQPLPDLASDHRLSAVIQWMTLNISKPLALDDLAKRALMSRRSFTRSFSKMTGTSVGKWLLNQRLMQAQRLLEVSRKSIEEIAHETGFGSAITLRKHFAENLGTSPSAYRRDFQQESNRRLQ